MVVFILEVTAIHVAISLDAHGRDGAQKEKIISRGSSLLIFIY